MSISNYLKTITFCDKESYELNIHREYSDISTQNDEESVTRIFNFLASKEINPLISGPQKLRNIVTQDLGQPEIS